MCIKNDSNLRFEWDPAKDISNQKKHGISFKDAATIFLDEEGLLIPDPDHSAYEERFIMIGIGRKAELLTVVHALREEGTVIRIISARRSTRNESRQYYERRNRRNERRIRFQ